MDSDKEKTNVFPSDFLWGASSSSHQVEGNNYNQWTVWELENAARLAKTAESKVLVASSVFNTYKDAPNWNEIKKYAQDPSNYVSGEGVDHYRKYKKDLELAKSLNLNAVRFSVEWSRIEPEEGKWDEEAIEHYRDYIKQIKKLGMEPILNIWHWTNPVWFEEMGGFLKHKNIHYFLRFAATIMEEYADELTYVIIFNEPNIYAYCSFGIGYWPTPKHSYFHMAKGYMNLVNAHRKAYKYLKQEHPHIQFTSVPQLGYNVPKDKDNWVDRLAASAANYANNWLWWILTRNHFDFIGFNNYYKNYIQGFNYSRFANPKEPVNEMGWYMEPKSVGEMALALHKRYPNTKIMVTENGVPDRHDSYRKWWIEESIEALEDCLKKGVPLIGYIHWSLLDNFEWAEGWWPKFGLIEVDREHGMKRHVRASAKWFAKKIRVLQQTYNNIDKA